MKRADIVKWLRQEAAVCEDLARIHTQRGKKSDAKAFDKKRTILTAAANEIENINK